MELFDSVIVCTCLVVQRGHVVDAMEFEYGIK